jgi:catechol 2,3-dioxygenase-like lactoylglutathione lyase family enzyme
MNRFPYRDHDNCVKDNPNFARQNQQNMIFVEPMKQHISVVTLLVPDYDRAIAYYVGRLGFSLVEDTPLSNTKRWVVVAPPGSSETGLLLAQADSQDQREAIGNQTGGRVFLILKTDGFDRDYARFKQAGIEFLEEPRLETYGKVVVFRDTFGNKWDLIEPLANHPG